MSGNLLHNQMILTPIAIDAHGRLGPMTRQNFYGTPPPAIPTCKQFKPNRPNAKAMYDRATTLPAPIGIFIKADQRWKQLQAEHPQHNQKFYGLSHYAPTPSITTIQQLGLGITHAFSTLIINSFKKLVHSQTAPAFNHDFSCLVTNFLAVILLLLFASSGGGGSLTFLRRQSASAASNATSAAAVPPPPPAPVPTSLDKSTLHKIGLFLGLQTESPTSYPTAVPTTAKPTTATPTDTPTMTPTNSPTEVPTKVPTAAPTGIPTDAPTSSPLPLPTTAKPTIDKDNDDGSILRLNPNETIIDPLNNTIIDPLDQLLSKYDIPLSVLDCDGGKDVVSSYHPPRLYPNGSAVLCVVVLNEKPYIDEWINYHLGLGFSKIVVYDNSASFDLREWRRQEQITPMVEVIHFPGLAPQERSYLTCAQSALNGDFGENKKWAAFFDVDEFLVLKKHEHVDELLEEHLPKGSGALSINWVRFSFNGKLLCDCHQTICLP